MGRVKTNFNSFTFEKKVKHVKHVKNWLWIVVHCEAITVKVYLYQALKKKNPHLPSYWWIMEDNS
jgi:hypothetical protein